MLEGTDYVSECVTEYICACWCMQLYTCMCVCACVCACIYVRGFMFLPVHWSLCVCTLACVFMCFQVIVRVYACPGDCACVCDARACACVCVIDLPTSSPNNNKP